jgi:hypothetical protein
VNEQNNLTKNHHTAQNQAGRPGRMVLLNALPLNSLPRRRVRLDIEPIQIAHLADWMQRKLLEGYTVEHYIRHASTIQVLRRDLGIMLSEANAGLYEFRQGDVLVVISLKTPQRGQEVQQLGIQDLEAWVVVVE